MINYVILACDEQNQELNNILENLKWNNIDFKSIVIITDGNETSQILKPIIERYNLTCQTYFHPLNKDFATHRNFAISKCWQPYIFYLDSDEIPNNLLLRYLPDIIKQNSKIDIFGIPRLNYLNNDTDLEKIPEWISPPEDKLGRINWPDYQYRIIRNTPKIRWVNKVHEVPTGGDVGQLPALPTFCLVHIKSVSGQIKRQNFYKSILKDNI